MWYQINVALNGRHFFDTGKSITDSEKAKLVFAALITRFTREAGFEVTVTRWEAKGQDMTALTRELIGAGL